MQHDESPDPSRKDRTTFGLSVGLVTILVGAFFSYAISNHGWAQEMGAWGDFVGGTLNPILTFITIILLLWTIGLQKQELMLTRKELERSSSALEEQSKTAAEQSQTARQQRFENTLFSMNDVLMGIVSRMEVERRSYTGDNSEKYRGVNCFSFFLSNLNEIYNQEGFIDELSFMYVYTDAGRELNSSIHNTNRIKISYGKFYNLHRADLGHYFRVLYNIFRYIDESEIDPFKYIKIIRAQISDAELLIIFYNCMHPLGEPMRKYALKFSLFEHLVTSRLIHSRHMNMLELGAFGGNPLIPPDDAKNAPGEWLEN